MTGKPYSKITNLVPHVESRQNYFSESLEKFLSNDTIRVAMVRVLSNLRSLKHEKECETKMSPCLVGTDGRAADCEVNGLVDGPASRSSPIGGPRRSSHPGGGGTGLALAL